MRPNYGCVLIGSGAIFRLALPWAAPGFLLRGGKTNGMGAATYMHKKRCLSVSIQN